MVAIILCKPPNLQKKKKRYFNLVSKLIYCNIFIFSSSVAVGFFAAKPGAVIFSSSVAVGFFVAKPGADLFLISFVVDSARFPLFIDPLNYCCYRHQCQLFFSCFIFPGSTAAYALLCISCDNNYKFFANHYSHLQDTTSN